MEVIGRNSFVKNWCLEPSYIEKIILLYLLFVTAPATFSESMFGPKNIKDAGDNQYTQGNLEYAPRYPVFNFENK